MTPLAEAVRAALDVAADEVVTAILSGEDVRAGVFLGTPWEVVIYTADRSGRCCFVYANAPMLVYANALAITNSSHYYSPGSETAVRSFLAKFAANTAEPMSAVILSSVGALVEMVGIRAAESVVADAVALSVMAG